MLVQEGDILYYKGVNNLPYEKTSVERITGRIMEILGERAELTSTAKQYIREYRTGEPKREWLEGVISAT
jgi:hypothetical protein